MIDVIFSTFASSQRLRNALTHFFGARFVSFGQQLFNHLLQGLHLQVTLFECGLECIFAVVLRHSVVDGGFGLAECV
jgi:hypothetical protein